MASVPMDRIMSDMARSAGNVESMSKSTDGETWQANVRSIVRRTTSAIFHPSIAERRSRACDVSQFSGGQPGHVIFATFGMV
jgi:hypothetical protein